MKTLQSGSKLAPSPLPADTSRVEDAIYTLPSLTRYPELLHGISTRRAPDGRDWNLSARRGTPQHPPDPAVAFANRRLLADSLGISLSRMVGCQQVHGAQVVAVGASDGGKGMSAGAPAIEGADALITDTPGLYLLALSADCPPVFFYDPVRHVVGLAHSGWRGTVGRIGASVVSAMANTYGSHPTDIVAAVGPGIGPCCYAVGANVIEEVERAFPASEGLPGHEPLLEEREGQIYFNLHATIRRTLLEAGLLPPNVSAEETCTAHNLHLFYSHRGEAGQCGLFGAVLGMRDE